MLSDCEGIVDTEPVIDQDSVMSGSLTSDQREEMCRRLFSLADTDQDGLIWRSVAASLSIVSWS